MELIRGDKLYKLDFSNCMYELNLGTSYGEIEKIKIFRKNDMLLHLNLKKNCIVSIREILKFYGIKISEAQDIPNL